VPERTHWISTPEQLKAVQSPIRHDLMDRLTVLGPSSVSVLAAALGCRPTAIYRHIRSLQRAGLVLPVTTAGARGRPATIYKAIAPRVRMARAPRNPKNRDILARIARTMANLAAREYGDAFRRGEWKVEGPGRNHWFFRLYTAPSPAKLARINALLDEVATLIWTPDPVPGPLLRITWIMSPTPPPKGSWIPKHRRRTPSAA